mmetsp:Transcript_16635/g.23294  ORF Transcript_16635/g.23294 Transcript_16635/m.23294 type:complete len:89 (+) Transcript_16635:170-436(+)
MDVEDFYLMKKSSGLLSSSLLMPSAIWYCRHTYDTNAKSFGKISSDTLEKVGGTVKDRTNLECATLSTSTVSRMCRGGRTILKFADML